MNQNQNYESIYPRVGKIDGPFIAQPSSQAGYRIIDSDGTEAIWVMGEENARIVVAALNEYFRSGE